MEIRYTFQLSSLDNSLLPEISKALEARTERLSRLKHPKLWEKTDRLNAGQKTDSDTVKKRRRHRRIILGLLNWFFGLFLLLPGLMEPEELMIPLLVGAFGWGSGVMLLNRTHKWLLMALSLLSGALFTFGGVINPGELGGFLLPGIASLAIALVIVLTRKRKKKTAFDKAAEKLLKGWDRAYSGEVIFDEDGMTMPDSDSVPYRDFEVILETENLIIPVYREQIIVLKKSDLLDADPYELEGFLSEQAELLMV